MTSPAKASEREAFAKEYASALGDYLGGAGAVALTSAHELGRKAAGVGVGVLEIAMLHHEALGELLTRNPHQGSAMAFAAQFLVESLSPFEMSLRAYQANARLLGLSETLAKQNGEIDRAREQLQTILDATTAVIYLKDSEGRYVFLNRQFQKVFGLAREEVIGKTNVQLLAACRAQSLFGGDRQILRERVPKELEETIQKADGAHTYLCLKFPLVDAAGAPYALCCVATDITERKRADEDLRHAKEAADEANRELESFSYSVAHDLRAPLRTIDGFSQAVLEEYEGSLDAQGIKYLRQVRQSAQEMALLIDDLLSLSRLSRHELRRDRVDLSRLARLIAERMKVTEPGGRVSFMIQDGVFLNGDAILLRAVLENLLANAWKFTGKREEARIELGQVQEPGGAVTFVRDNGAGFDMEHAGKLFGVFQRLHSAKEFEGNGIGLATVQRIVRRHGGQVWAEAAVDKGATFFFSLGEAERADPTAVADQRTTTTGRLQM